MGDNQQPAGTSASELAARAAAALRLVVGHMHRPALRRDSLTGLFDSRTLDRELAGAAQAAARNGGHLGLLFIDLDHFKRVNDRHGHLTGSRILSQVAGLVDRAASHAGGFAARYGGDEFVVVLPGADLDRSVRHAERLRATLASTILPGGEPPRRRPLVRVTCSIGTASLRPGEANGAPAPVERTPVRLLQHADNAMYQAKRAGRNRVAASGARAAGVA